MSGAAVLVTARVEAVRLLLHPWLLAAVVLSSVAAVLEDADTTTAAMRASVTAAPVFALGVPAMLAAWSVATRPVRDGAEELLAAMPAPSWTRTAGLLVAGLVPALLACLAAACAAALTWVRGGNPAGAVGFGPGYAPELGEYVAVPVAVLGGTWLAVAAARWLPVPGVGLLVAALCVLWAGACSGLGGSAAWFGPYLERLHYETQSRLPGDADWHAAYLAALSGLAGVAALLRDAPARRGLLVMGAALGVLAVAAGAAQLP